MSSRQYGSYSSLIDFTRASSGTALRPISYGDELVTNGTFDTDSDWIKQTGWSISGGSANWDGLSSVYIQQGDVFEPNTLYTITFTISNNTSGTISIRDGAAAVLVPNTTYANGTYSFNVVSTSNSSLRIYGVSGSGSLSIDNISVREVLFDQPDGTLTLFNHPTNIPRIEYDADGNRLGLLVEESRTNLLPYSEDFSNAAWNKVRGDIASESIIDPSGGQNTYSWTSNDFAETYIYDSSSISSGATITLSAFIKKKTSDYCHLLVWDNFSNGCRVWFDLVNGQVGSDTAFGSTFSVAGSSITEYPNGWYRCSMTVSTSGTTTAIGRLSPSNGDANISSSIGKSIYIYGAQLEQGSFPTSYIPTSGSTTTRSADVASIGVSEFGYNQNAGTVVVSGTYFGSGVLPILDSDDLNERERLYYQTAEQFFVVDDGVTQANMTGASLSGSFNTAYVVKKDDFALLSSGVLRATDTSGTVPTISTYKIGSDLAGRYLNGHIKSIKYYPRRLTNAQLQELTS